MFHTAFLGMFTISLQTTFQFRSLSTSNWNLGTNFPWSPSHCFTFHRKV